jgi:2-polyprenyl-6-methoxyphenol hydroxylase-like FAD-dependent oxidoreductase
VTLVEKRITVDSQPRAAHLMAPGIQILRRAGVLEDVQRAGFLPKNLTFRKLDGTPIVSIEDVAVSKSPEATVVLPIGMLGNILVSHAEKNSKISLMWGHTVVDVGQDENTAWAIVKKDDGTETRITGDFLCGCDGGTSQVRKSLFGAKNFPGKTWDVQFVATNVSAQRGATGFVTQDL